MRMEPASIDEWLEDITDPVERMLELWRLHDFTDKENPIGYLLSYDQWVGLADKYTRQE